MKLKKKFMLNYEGEDWVCLSDFNKIKNKLKKTQKEKAKLESCIQSFYGKPMDYDIACRIVTKLLNEKTVLKAEIIQLRESLEADFQRADKKEYELATKFNNTYFENKQLKELLKAANKFLKDYGLSFDGKDCAEAFKVHAKINEVLK